MCFTSVVYDHFQPWVPQTITYTTSQWLVNPPGLTAVELQEFLDAFHKAVEAAKVFDRLTGAPDCEDPEKAALEARVAALEQALKELTDGPTP